jgi:hypothetical protein
VSDAFKRAVTKWGPGRNIYDLPRLWATCKVGRNGTPYKTKETDADIARQLSKLGIGGKRPVKVADEPRETPAPKAVAKAIAASDDGGVSDDVWEQFLEVKGQLSEARMREVRKFWFDQYGDKPPSRHDSTTEQIVTLIAKATELLENDDNSVSPS